MSSYNYAPPAAVLAVSILFPVLGSIVVALRFLNRRRKDVFFGLDDWLLIPVLALEWIVASLLIWGAATHSLGVPLPPPTVPGPEGYLLSNSEQQIRMSKIQYFVDWIGTIALGLLKTSILLFYRKVFCTARAPRDVFSIMVLVTQIAVIAWTITFTLGNILRCGSDPSAGWGIHVYVSKECPHSAAIREGSANSDFILDVLIWLMPIPKIWSLHMPIRRRIAVICVFLIGILAIAASAVRMSINYTVLRSWLVSTNQGEIFITDLVFWTVIEIGTSLIVVCLLTLRSFFGELTLRNVLSGIRSAISLQSLRSRSSDISANSRTRNPQDLCVKKEGETTTHISAGNS